MNEKEIDFYKFLKFKQREKLFINIWIKINKKKYRYNFSLKNNVINY